MKIRVKFHQMPGDVPKQDKIEMMEDKNHPLHRCFIKNIIKPRERAALKRETDRLISEPE